MHNDHCHRVTAQLQLINIIFYFFFYFGQKTFVAKLIKKKRLSGTRALRRGVWMIGGVNPHILKLGNGWRWMSSFMPIALSPRKIPLWSVRLTASLSNILLWSVKLTTSLSKVDEQLHADCIIPEKEPLGTHCLGGFLGPRSGLDFYENGKFVAILGIWPLFIGCSARRLLTISIALLENIIQNATLNIVQILIVFVKY